MNLFIGYIGDMIFYSAVEGEGLGNHTKLQYLENEVCL